MSTAARTAHNLWGSTVFRSTVVGLGVFGALLTTGLLRPASATADDSSAVTVTAAEQDPDVTDAPFPDLSVTVSQTQGLTSQGIRVSYSGGERSGPASSQVGGTNFLQIMQCWGDLKDAAGALVLDAAGQPQPDRTTCQYGATGAAGQSRTSTKAGGTEYLSPEDEPYFYPGAGVFTPPEVSVPFRSVTGKTLARVVDGAIVPGVDPDSNEFFTKFTTNEVAWAPFDASGSGVTTFEVQTNMQAPGLGCGNPQTAADGSVVGRPCWLVVVPRGTHDWGETQIVRSGLLAETWTHRLAVRLDFKPLGLRCPLGAAERSLAGSELMTTAVASWQPKLCGASSGSVYNLLVSNEADQALEANGTGTAPLALTTRALSEPGVTDALTYAPVAVTGLTIAFAVDHRSNSLGDVSDEVRGRDGQPFTQLQLTPRLVAKLLTGSYRRALPRGAVIDYLGDNPETITSDPDFLAINDPVWADQSLNAPSVADALVPLGRSDAAWTMWRYVLADPEAVDFLAGRPDPWGMVVNPYSSTDPTINPTGTAATYPADSFPKADPVEADTNKDPNGLSVVNLVTWRPYAPDLDTAGYWVLRGDGRLLGDWDNVSVPHKFSAATRSPQGSQMVIGLTDTAAAAKYHVYTAALRNPAGSYVVPTTSTMSAAAAVMTPDPDQSQVLRLDYGAKAVQSAADAYPLTVPVYAATNPLGGDQASRQAYSAFVLYAVGDGQTVGTDDGELPAGYAPLAAAWRDAARSAARAIAAGPPAVAAPDGSTTTPTLTAATVDPGAGRSPSGPTGASPAVGASAPLPSSPTATGDAAGALTGAPTPDDPSVGTSAATVPLSAAGGLAAAAAVPLLTRRRRVV